MYLISISTQNASKKQISIIIEHKQSTNQAVGVYRLDQDLLDVRVDKQVVGVFVN